MPSLRDIQSMLDLASISSHDILVNKLKTDVRMRASYATALALQPFMYRSDGTYYELMNVYVHAPWYLFGDDYNDTQTADYTLRQRNLINLRINEAMCDYVNVHRVTKKITDIIEPTFMTAEAVKRGGEGLRSDSFPLYMLLVDYVTGHTARVGDDYEFPTQMKRRKWLVKKLFRRYS